MDDEFRIAVAFLFYIINQVIRKSKQRKKQQHQTAVEKVIFFIAAMFVFLNSS